MARQATSFPIRIPTKTGRCMASSQKMTLDISLLGKVLTRRPGKLTAMNGQRKRTSTAKTGVNGKLISRRRLEAMFKWDTTQRPLPEMLERMDETMTEERVIGERLYRHESICLRLRRHNADILHCFVL